MHCLSTEEREKWIEDYLERETAVARKRVQDAEAAIMQEHDDMSTAENAGATTSKSKKTFEEMLNAIGVSLSDLATSDDEQDGEYEENDEEDTELGKLRMMTNLARRWAQFPKQYSTTWGVIGRSWWGMTNWRNRYGGTQPTTAVGEIWRLGQPNWWFQQLSSPK